MNGDEKQHERENASGSSLPNVGNKLQRESIVVLVLPQRGPLKTSRWREALGFLSEFLPPTMTLVLQLSIFMFWVLLMGAFLFVNRFMALAWFLLGVSVVLGIGYHVRSFDVEKERAKTRRT